MDRPLHEIVSNNHSVWINKPNEVAAFSERRDTAFHVALQKFIDRKGNVETVLQTAEAFGRGLFSDTLHEVSKDWTLQTWIESAIEHVFNPMNNAFTFTAITDDEATAMITQNPLLQRADEPSVVALFTYGFIRGLFMSAFPHGEVLLQSTNPLKTEMTELVFRTNASYKDKFERERVKHSFMVTKKL